MKLNVKIAVALIGLASVLGTALIHSCSRDETTVKDNPVNVGKNVATGDRAVAGDNAQVNNSTTNNTQNFYGFKPEDLEHITTLFPGNETTPRNACDGQQHLPNSLTILLGDSAAVTNIFSHTILGMAGEAILVVDRDGENGNLIIKTLRVYDENDNRIAQIIGDGKLNKTFFNELYLRPNKPDLSNFALYDRRDKKILDVRFLNSTTLSVQGIFHNHGAETIITESQIFLNGGIKASAQASCFAYSGIDMNI